MGKNINIHHECEGGIEKSVPRIPQKYLKNLKKDFKKILNKHYNDVTDLHVASVRLFVFYLSLGLVRVCEKDITQIRHRAYITPLLEIIVCVRMGKNNRNPILV